LSIFPSSFFLLPSFSSERKKHFLVRKEEGKMKKEEETPDFTGVSLCTLFNYFRQQEDQGWGANNNVVAFSNSRETRVNSRLNLFFVAQIN
jgi:hypothetical protein